MAQGDSAGGVQSVNRAFEILEGLADAGGSLGVSQLATATGLPLPTIHRLLQSLTASGYVRQEPSRRYALGARLMRLGNTASHALSGWATPYLAELVAAIGETANLAMLEGDAAVYLAQVPSQHSVRMFTEVGRRVPPHCTGVGKALLAALPDDEVRQLIARTGLPAQTEHSITTVPKLLLELGRIRRQGYAVDEGEQELGVRCVAVPIAGGPGNLALSVSGPSGRLTKDRVGAIAPRLLDVARGLAAQLSGQPVSD